MDKTFAEIATESTLTANDIPYILNGIRTELKRLNDRLDSCSRNDSLGVTLFDR